MDRGHAGTTVWSAPPRTESTRLYDHPPEGKSRLAVRSALFYKFPALVYWPTPPPARTMTDERRRELVLAVLAVLAAARGS